jgi:transcriptional regulator with XRE-family HTH domain
MQVREFGEFLRILRVNKGMTIVEVASKTGVVSTLISQLELGIRRSFPRHETMKHLAEFFDFEFQYIPEQMLIIDCPRPPIMQKSNADEESYAEAEVYKTIKTLKDHEKDTIIRTLNKNKGSRERTALELDIGERTLYRKIKEYHIT